MEVRSNQKVSITVDFDNICMTGHFYSILCLGCGHFLLFAVKGLDVSPKGIHILILIVLRSQLYII